MLDVENVVARHGLLTAVRDVSLTVRKGEVLAIIGANGAGKTTLFRSMAGVHTDMTGRIRLGGTDISTWSPAKRVAAGLERDHRQCRAQVAQLGDVLPIQPPLPGLPRMAQAGAPPTDRRTGFAFLPFDENFQVLGPLPDQPITHAATEAASVGHQVQGLQQAGLAGAVVAQDQIEPRPRMPLHRVEAAETMQGESIDQHSAAEAKAGRRGWHADRAAYGRSRIEDRRARRWARDGGNLWITQPRQSLAPLVHNASPAPPPVFPGVSCWHFPSKSVT